MNAVAYFEIQSSNPSRDIIFYERAFGWKFTRDKTIPMEYYRIQSETMAGGMLKRPVPVPPSNAGTNAFTCSMEVKDFDATAKIILNNGGQVAMPKFAIPKLCWQGYFTDPDNNVFGIFQPDENAK